MKHGIFMKGIALLLCVVSLLGIVGTGLGIWVLTEGELYNRTVDQMLQEQIQTQGQSLAQSLASRYASTTLGGASGQLTSERFPIHYYGILGSNYGYAILDAEGNLLDSLGSQDTEQGSVYRFSVSGQYLHQVSLMTEGEKYPAYQSDPSASGKATMSEGLYLYDDVPAEGAVVTNLMVTFADGSNFNYGSEALGSVYYARDGFLVCRIMDPYLALPVNTTVTDLILVSNGGLVYEANSLTGVGYFTQDAQGSGLVFRSTVKVEEESVETEVENTVPETTVPETIPETTVPETVPETTVPEAELELLDNLPEEGVEQVITLYVKFADGEEYSHQDEYGIGRVRHLEDGSVMFTAYEAWDCGTGEATIIVMLGEEEEILFKATCEEGIGEVEYNDNDLLTYHSRLPVPAEETVPETTEETVPETTLETVPETTVETVPQTTMETVPVTEPVMINGKPLWEYEVNTGTYFDHNTQQTMYADYVYIPMPEYTVELYLTEDSFNNPEIYEILRTVRSFRNSLLPVMGGCILVFLLTVVYLVCAAAHKPRTDSLQAGGLNRIPLDLYLMIVALGVPCLCVIAMEGSMYLLRQNMATGCACAVGCGFSACLLVVGFLFAAVAQFKTPGGFWWHNTMCARVVRLMYRLCVWLQRKLRKSWIPILGGIVGKLWLIMCTCLVWLYRKTEKLFIRTGRVLRAVSIWLKDTFHRFLCLLPLTWQWLVGGFLILLMIALIFATNGEELLMVLCIFGSVSLIIYGAHCFGTLLDSTKKMRKGDLNIKVDDKMMVGAFKEFAGELNELAGVAVVAAQKQLNSERMKSELITNVSHDIKTPLTSIINYVDLLQKPHTDANEAEYLEVLARQSQQLKKLLEDLMDMSKASTGNMNVEITCLDAVESVNQALGEFSDKLEKARLTPVFRHTEAFVPMMADGRLVWRVLNNLLGNAVKYAMPGTRLYLDLIQLDGNVVISLKNISREELTVDAEELMERFVRGDDSRNTEGSGLGLNIAKSLTELQKGQMQLLVDGDLFKVTLIFPGA